MSKNTGENNSGNWNSGNWNSRDWNSGDCNSGHRNSGDRNSGYKNSGHKNSGDWNSGDCNSGNYNSGYGNSTNGSSGIFCSNEPTVVLFNKDSGKQWDEINHPHFNEFYPNKWIPYADLTSTQKKENPSCETTEGLLVTYTYQEAWANFWKDTDEVNRQKFLKLPNFDAKIFKDITGINVTQNNQKTELLQKADELIAKANELKKQAEKL